MVHCVLLTVMVMSTSRATLRLLRVLHELCRFCNVIYQIFASLVFALQSELAGSRLALVGGLAYSG